jgi:hypothetical protein
MNKKYHVREKAFLSLDKDERDYVVAVVEDAREKYLSCTNSVDCTEISLRIADWRHEIELYFNIETVEERENSLYKVRTLAEVINVFKRALESEIEVLNARQSVPRHSRISSAIH